jgi:hypothetical protein
MIAGLPGERSLGFFFDNLNRLQAEAERFIQF